MKENDIKMKIFIKGEKSRGFSLIELLVALSIIAILSTIAFPIYLGFKDKARVASFKASARGIQSELGFWLQAALSKTNKIEVDTNFDGVIDNNDKSNLELFNEGVAFTYSKNRNLYKKEKSPWDSSLPLWNSDGTTPPGRLSLLQISNNQIKIIGKGGSGETLIEILISED